MTDQTERQENVLLTLEEAAARLRVKPTTVKRWAREGRIPARKIVGNWRFPSDELEQWIEAQAA